MSSKSIELYILTLVVVMMAGGHDHPRGYLKSHNPDAQSTGWRTSMLNKKIGFKEAKLAAKHTAKIGGPMHVSIELIGTQPSAEGDAFALEGVVTSEEELLDVEFAWRVPKELEVVNGSLKSVINSVSPEKPYFVQVTLRQKGFENGRVHFRARASRNGMRFSDTAQYNSMMQEIFEASRAELKKSSQEEFAEQKAAGIAPLRKTIQFINGHPEEGSSLKVFH